MLNNEDFAEEYTEDYEPELITMVDEDGAEVEFELLDVVEYQGEEYVVLLPTEDEESGDVVILLIESIDDENETYIGIDDEDTLQAVFDVFKEKNKDYFDFD